MPDEANTTEDISASPAVQDDGASIVSATPDVSPAPPEDGAVLPDSSASGETEGPEIPTAQILGNEPLEVETPSYPLRLANTPRPSATPLDRGDFGTPPEEGTKLKTAPELPSVGVENPQANKSFVYELLVKAGSAIQSRKRKKLDKIMNLFLKHPKITNDEVEKLLHVSDATATRLLAQLEKENKIRRVGKTGHYVAYEKI